jgi:hypothetical protein
MNDLPDLKIVHHRIENQNSLIWDMTPFIFKEGTKVNRSKNDWLKKVTELPLANDRVDTIYTLKEHADKENKCLDSSDAINQALYDYSEYEFNRTLLGKLKPGSAYHNTHQIALFIKTAFDGINFNIKHTRLKKDKNSRRAINRNTEKALISDASKLARFCFGITQNFKLKDLERGTLPIYVNLKTPKQSINLTPQIKMPRTETKGFLHTAACHGINNRISAELMIFLAMTVQNIAPTLKLTRAKFDYKPLGDKYEIREYKYRRGGEVLFKIPKQYRPYFEKYLNFINKYAPNSKWLFPFLQKGIGYQKRSDGDIITFKRICTSNQIPWISPKKFRHIGLNILMRLCSDEETSAEYANHGIAVFRASYEFPSLQRAIIEVTQFWEKNDPLNHGRPMISLFNTPCNGMPEPINDATSKLPKPDCISPTGCIGCKHYRDEESLDYVWNLHSFKYLKIIESSSHRTKELKPSNIAIDWTNLKINWFINSANHKHKEWVEESEVRIQEGDYHPSWSRKIEKYEG